MFLKLKKMKEHYKRLEEMYLNAPVQKMYPGITINVFNSSAEISLPVDPRYFHAGQAVHGSVYFRLLDDAAYFAVSSLVQDVFVVTSSFHIDLLRPINKGVLTARGKVLHVSKKLFLAEAILTDERNRKIALGKGSFMKSSLDIKNVKGYEKRN